MFVILTNMLVLMLVLSNCESDEQKQASRKAPMLSADSKKSPKATDQSKKRSSSESSDKTSDDDDDDDDESIAGVNCSHAIDINLNNQLTSSGQTLDPQNNLVNFDFTADGTIVASARDIEGSFSLTLNVTQFNPPQGQAGAERGFEQLANPLTLSYPPLDEQKAIYKEGAWLGMDCVAKPVMRIATAGTEITYDPPIPFLINSQINESALKTPKVFSNIKATIVRHPTAAPGDYMGTATISRQQNLVLVTFDFGGVSPGNQATPAKQIEFEINSEVYESVRYQVFSADNQTLDLKVLKN